MEDEEVIQSLFITMSIGVLYPSKHKQQYDISLTFVTENLCLICRTNLISVHIFQL